MSQRPADGQRGAPTLAASLEAARRPSELRGRRFLGVALLLSLAWGIVAAVRSGAAPRASGLSVLADLLRGMLHPDVSAAVMSSLLGAAAETVAYAAAGTSLALALGVPLGILSSGVLLSGGARRVAITIGRGVLAALRSVHELVWAWLFVAALGLSPMAAVLALAIPYAGILGRIFAELLTDVAEPPLDALRASGSDERQVLLYGRIPAALPDMTAYAFYRFECAVRSSAVMGFVGVGGLGLELQLALTDLRFGAVATYLLALAVLVIVIEAWSARVRRELAA